jgi:hypothetical protein
MKRRVLALLLVFLGVGHVVVRAAGGALPALPALPSLPSLSASSSNMSVAPESMIAPVASNASMLPAISPNSAVLSVFDTSAAVSAGADARGSWFKKRHWLLKAREQQEKINGLVAQIQDVGGAMYDAKRSAFNQDAAAFYEKNSVGRGQIDQLLEQLAPYFNQPSKSDDGSVVDKDMARLSTSKKFQDYFDNTVLFAQLQSDLKAIVDIDSGVSERVTQYEKCSQQALQKSAEAQALINDMFGMINHEKARDSYYKLEGMATFLDALLKFVKNDLAGDLDKVMALGRTKMDEVSKVVGNVRLACEAIKKNNAASDVKATPSGDSSAISDESRSASSSSSKNKKSSEQQAEEVFSGEALEPRSFLYSVVRFFAQIFYSAVDFFTLLLGK